MTFLMHAHTVRTICLASLISVVEAASGMECIHETPKSDRGLDVQTSLGIGAIKRLLGQAKIGLDVKAKQIEIYSKYPKADQLVMNEDFMFMICTSIRDDNSLSPMQKTEQLFKLRREIFSPAVDVPTLPLPARPKPTSQPASSAQAATWRGNHDQYRSDFLKPAPSVLTNENRYFVVAASPNNQSDADSLYVSDTAAFPNVDFVIFPPYRTNVHYALMMGTWLSRPEANRVIQIATEIGLRPAPYIWRFGNASAGIHPDEGKNGCPSGQRVDSKTLRCR